jgi:hypothetical protein
MSKFITVFDFLMLLQIHEKILTSVYIAPPLGYFSNHIERLPRSKRYFNSGSQDGGSGPTKP